MSIISRTIPVLAVTATLGLGAAPALAHSGHHGGDGGSGSHGSGYGHSHHSSKAKRVCGLDRVWLKHIAQADLAEVATGNLAEEKGTSEGVKALGAMLVTDHTKHLQQVQTLAGTIRVTLPTAPAPWQQWQADVLGTLSGAAFDQAWATAQVADHLTNIDETQDEIADGCNRAVRALASATLPVLQMHLAEAQKLAGTDTGTGGDTGTGTGTGTGTETGSGTETGTDAGADTSGDSSSCDHQSSYRHRHGDDGCCGDDDEEDGGSRPGSRS
jgi:putative membrane protein